jgi:YidC/Oxa1 family membrane protein insertase
MTLVPGERSLKDGLNELEVKFESADVGGVKLVKTYTLKRGAYDIAVRHDILNTGTAAISPQLYMQLVRDGNKPPGESSFYSTFTGPAIYTEAKKYQKVEFKDIENNKVDVEKQSSNGYVAMVQHYFASAWILGDGIKRDLFFRKVDNNLYAVGMITPLDSIAPGATKTLDSKFFVGPQEEKPWKPFPRPGTGEGLRLAHHPGQAACTGCSTSCMALSTTGAGPSWRWCCC